MMIVTKYSLERAEPLSKGSCNKMGYLAAIRPLSFLMVYVLRVCLLLNHVADELRVIIVATYYFKAIRVFSRVVPRMRSLKRQISRGVKSATGNRSSMSLLLQVSWPRGACRLYGIWA